MGALKSKPPIKDDNHDIIIDQLDGNMTLGSSIISNSDCSSCDSTLLSDTDLSLHEVSEQTWKKSASQQIPVITNIRFNNLDDPPSWYEYYTPRKVDENESKKNRFTIRRDDRLVFGEALPIISVSNLRSLGPKLKNFKIDMLEREIGVSLLSEVWEKTECKKQNYEIEKMFQMDGLKYISTPRS